MTRHPWPFATLAFATTLFAAGCQEGPDSTDAAHRSGGFSLASASEVPLELRPNRVGTPVTGSQGLASLEVAAKGEGKEEPKDYWAAIPFDRRNYDEVRSFVREHYIETDIDDSRAFSQAAAFALASDEDRVFLLFPDEFYQARKDHPDEEGGLAGKVRMAKAGRFVILEDVPDKEKERKRLTDDEIRALRAKDRLRTEQLENGWAKAKFTAEDFESVMVFVSKNLGKHPDWSVKKAWVGATQGYLYSLDPHSSLISKEAWEDSTKEITDASFEGIGAILTRRQESDYTIVESPLEGQPAVAAGLRAGDVIIKVDGNSIKGELLPKVVSRIRGPKATRVVLTVERVGEPKALDIAIIRSRIEMKNIQVSTVPDHEGFGRIKINGFVPTTEEALNQAFRELSEAAPNGKLRGLVLDLRNNSGGLLKQGISVADHFLKRGVIVSVKNRGEADEVYRAVARNYWDLPLVTLVNDGSASASEIVASAIQDNGRGLVIGDRTFGKASVQTLFSPLYRDDYYIKLSVARYYRPSGDTLQVVGVQPDVLVSPDIDGKMPLGFREENLSNHLAPLDTDNSAQNPILDDALQRCVKKTGAATRLHAIDPNPAVKFDNQLMVAADYLECMQAN